MKIVIDIDENVYTRLFDNGTEDYGIMNDDLFAIAKSIRNGTPLPKGHGRLIDADKLKEHKYHDNHRYENAVAVAYIDWADAIIETADNAESEN